MTWKMLLSSSTNEKKKKKKKKVERDAGAPTLTTTTSGPTTSEGVAELIQLIVSGDACSLLYLYPLPSAHLVAD